MAVTSDSLQALFQEYLGRGAGADAKKEFIGGSEADLISFLEQKAIAKGLREATPEYIYLNGQQFLASDVKTPENAGPGDIVNYGGAGTPQYAMYQEPTTTQGAGALGSGLWGSWDNTSDENDPRTEPGLGNDYRDTFLAWQAGNDVDWSNFETGDAAAGQGHILGEVDV